MQIATPPADRLAALAQLPGVGVVNLEGPVATGGALSAGQLFNHPAVVDDLSARGVAIIGIANNHRSDRGPAGIATTRAAIVSAGAQVADRDCAAQLTIAGRVVQVIAGEVDDLPAMRAALGASADLRIASLHVLAPPSYIPDPTTIQAVDALIAAGAEVVAVHGSHALAAVEWRQGALVAWGLGNLAFDCECTREDEALVLALQLDGDGLSARVIPIRAGLHGAAIAPHPDAAGILTLLRGLGSRLDATGSVVRVGAQPDGQRDHVRR